MRKFIARYNLLLSVTPALEWWANTTTSTVVNNTLDEKEEKWDVIVVSNEDLLENSLSFSVGCTAHCSGRHKSIWWLTATSLQHWKSLEKATNSFGKFSHCQRFLFASFGHLMLPSKRQTREKEELWKYKEASWKWRTETRIKSSYSKFHEKFKWARSHYVVIFFIVFSARLLIPSSRPKAQPSVNPPKHKNKRDLATWRSARELQDSLKLNY